MIWVEAVATVFGLICVWFTVKQNILCWPTGLIQVLLYIVIFYAVKLYSDVGLQIIYVFMQIYGWYHWLHGGPHRAALPVSSLDMSVFVIWMLVGIAGTTGLGYFMHTNTDAAAPYPDAFVAIISLIAQWLMSRKNLESWYFWIAVDVVAIAVYLYKDLYLTAGLYCVFLVLACMGYALWKKSLLSDIVLAESMVQ